MVKTLELRVEGEREGPFPGASAKVLGCGIVGEQPLHGRAERLRVGRIGIHDGVSGELGHPAARCRDAGQAAAIASSRASPNGS